jgi:hypothetical protein
MRRHPSALLALSLGWDKSSILAITPKKSRVYVQRESMAWQQLSQHASDPEMWALPSQILRRRIVVNGKEIPLPTPRRRPPPNRLLELLGLAGAIGEQIGLAWTAERDVQRLIATAPNRMPEHQRLLQRALAETAAYFLLGACHSLANFVLRLALLDTAAAKYLDESRFPVFSEDREAWISLNKDGVRRLKRASRLSSNRFTVNVTESLATLRRSKGFTSLETRRGMDYHRRRPQSVEHSSPRREAVVQSGNLTSYSHFAEALEPEADADHVHALVVDCMDATRTAMREIRRLMPKLIRAEGITYVIDDSWLRW